MENENLTKSHGKVMELGKNVFSDVPDTCCLQFCMLYKVGRLIDRNTVVVEAVTLQFKMYIKMYI